MVYGFGVDRLRIWGYVVSMTHSNLADHPGHTFTAAGSGYRLYRDGVFAGWFPTFAAMVAEVAR